LRPRGSGGNTGGARPPSRASIATLRVRPAPRPARLGRTRSTSPTTGRAGEPMRSRGNTRPRS
jgi:hypothetical protein